jgi:hypothetical protein
MELTRRQFMIYSSTATVVSAFPAVYVALAKNLKEDYYDFKNFTFEQIEQLDKYVMSSLLPSITMMLLLAYTLEMQALFAVLLIIFLSLLVLI